MAENKTKPTETSAIAFLKKIDDPTVREDCLTLLRMMQAVAGTPPVMWGSSIVGFGTRHYVYESGREGDTPVIGFSPRKQNIAMYLAGGLDRLRDDLVMLGRHKEGKGCLYIRSLKDIETSVLKRILSKAFKSAKP